MVPLIEFSYSGKGNPLIDWYASIKNSESSFDEASKKNKISRDRKNHFSNFHVNKLHCEFLNFILS
jgi:hypothetical protein